MKKFRQADYSRIAEVYDRNTKRRNEKPDNDLAAFLAGCSRQEIRVLDAGCGTGSYLAAQMKHFPDNRIRWFGMDPSPEMLAAAEKKLSQEAVSRRCQPGQVVLSPGKAESMPFESGYFDYVITSFTFHHFSDKAQAISGFRRILREGGRFVCVNIVPEEMEKWWVYHFFPEARVVDHDRFWSVGRIHETLGSAGFESSYLIRKHVKKRSLREILETAGNREISELDIIGDEAFASGISLLEKQIAEAAGDEGYYLDIFAQVRFISEVSYIVDNKLCIKSF